MSFHVYLAAENRRVTRMWTTRSGHKIRICDMTDLHLRHTVAMLARKHLGNQLNAGYPSFGGEMAQYYAEQSYEAFLESEPDESFPIFHWLCVDADRRGLDLTKEKSGLR